MTERSLFDDDREAEEFERLGRRAGEDLRRPAPADGHRLVERSGRTRRATGVAAGVGVTLLIVVTGLVVVKSRSTDHALDTPSAEAGTTTLASDSPTPATTVPGTTVPSWTVARGDGAPVGGFWRMIDAPTGTQVVLTAVWTGSEAIVLENLDSEVTGNPLMATAYDIKANTWRRLADPPELWSIIDGPRGRTEGAWTGSEVLYATSEGHVFSYDPSVDAWSTRDESLSLDPASDNIAVSAQGVLAASVDGWWWFDPDSDEWQPVPSPAFGADYSLVAALDERTVVATRVQGSEVTSSVFDVASRSWREGPVVRAPSAEACRVVEALVLCYVENFGKLSGVVIDPLVGQVGAFSLGNHSNTLDIDGVPWFGHAWKLYSPRSNTWVALPDLDGIEGFGSAVWTGSELVFFGGSSAGGLPTGAVAAYTPAAAPGT